MKHLLSASALWVMMTGAALAQSVEQQVISALEAQGYRVLELHDTWLGRLRVIAENTEVRRELVFNPGTGEILRDYVVRLAVLDARALADRNDNDSNNDDDVSAATVMSDEELRATGEMQADDMMFIPEAIVPPGEE